MTTPMVTEMVAPVETMQPMVQAMVEPQEAPKPYTFRRFSSPDIFPMFKIIGKIGLKEFTAAIDKDVLKELIASFTEGKGEESFAVNGATVILGIADVIISKLPNCENDIYQLLSQTSDLSVDEVKALDAAVFLEMVIDFIKKDDFKDFIKVVSKLFN
jgi:hypothetical protein